jgi:Tfp pilus assembly protein PilF
VDALRRRSMENAPGADRIAALAYRTGRYELAHALAQKQESALAWWVRAKLALRRGDSEAAAQAYARAAQGFPKADASLEPNSAGLLMAEQGVLTLSRGQYVEALDQLRRAARASARQDGNYYSSFGNYGNDMSYVAERVLTADELKAYIDARVPASPMPAPEAVAKATRKEQGPMAARYAAMSLSPPSADDRLRQLLARRLVREGRVQEALPYFPDERDERFVESSYESGAETPVSWRTRAKAREYGEALERAAHGWRSTARAEGWYRAALIARRQGMEIMGYEQGPDYAVYGGGYTYGAGRDGSVYYDAGNGGKPRPATAQGRAEADLAGPFITAEERKRYAASEAQPYKRFHYRDIAADYAAKAADELPPRSQAFAAALCQGVNFVFYDAQRSSELYRRYVKQGAAVPFSVDFGQNCVEPDFAAAARFPYVQAWRGARTWVARHRAASAALLLAAVLAGAGGIARYRRRRRPA